MVLGILGLLTQHTISILMHLPENFRTLLKEGNTEGKKGKGCNNVESVFKKAIEKHIIL